VQIPPNVTATAYIPAANPSDITESGKPAEESRGVKELGNNGSATMFELGSGAYYFESKL
jgi:alpha-L-rhamnosidase